MRGVSNHDAIDTIPRYAAKRPLLGMRKRIRWQKRGSALAHHACLAIIAPGNQMRGHKRNDRGNAQMPAKLKIHIDQDKCQGYVRCKSQWTAYPFDPFTPG